MTLNKILFLISLLLLGVTEMAVSQKMNTSVPNKQRSAVYKHKADALVALMTLEEKAGQLCIYGAGKKNLKKLIKDGLVGGTSGMLPRKTKVSDYLTRMQKIAVDSSRLGIPLLFMGDVIHGYRTTFPVNIAVSCSWDTALIRKMDSVAAFEAAADGMNWTFAPMVDISRDPRWGRVVEGAGEDPFLASAIAVAEVKGFQGSSLAHPRTLAATAKHFAAYGAVMAGRDYNSVELSWRLFHEVYLPPFQAAIDAGLATVMPAFISLNGIPASENKHLLTDILREECGFNGLVVSDYDAIPELMNHRVAATPVAAAKASFQAGMDMDLHSGTYLQTLPELVRENKVSEQALDAAVKRVLLLKFKLGLFDHPFLYGNKSLAYQDTLLKKHRPLARKVAREAMVLLKNNSLEGQQKRILPLSDKVKKIALIGPLVKNKKDLLGPVHAKGLPEEVITVWQGVKEALPKDAKLYYAKGTDINSASTEGFDSADSIARLADVVIMAVGESAGMSGEGDSRSMLGLPGNQLELVKSIVKTGQPVVVLLMNGRPLTIPWLDKHVTAILETWLPGTETGHAIADVLFGKYNPSGKLTMTFPRNTGQIPIFYNHQNTGRPKIPGNKYTSRYTDVPNTPLYPFGYGLSYTDFTYSIPKLSTDSLGWADSLDVTVKVTNIGSMEGTAIAQLYISDLIASISPPVKALKGFKRIHLQPRESQTIHFYLTKKDLSFYGKNMEWIAEPGKFEVYIGGSSTTKNKTDFWLLNKQ